MTRHIREPSPPLRSNQVWGVDTEMVRRRKQITREEQRVEEVFCRRNELLVIAKSDYQIRTLEKISRSSRGRTRFIE